MEHPRNIVGPQVRRVRVQIDLTQQQLAEKCQLIGWDVGRETIAKIEGQTRWVADFELLNLSCSAPEKRSHNHNRPMRLQSGLESGPQSLLQY
jgi:DNA-binding XRE family transcriptional regulator